MARFIIAASRRAPTGEASVEIVDAVFARRFAGIAAIKTESPPNATRHRLVFDGDSEEVLARARDLPPTVRVEPEIIHRTALVVQVVGSLGPIADAMVMTTITRSPNHVLNLPTSTGADGVSYVEIPNGFQVLAVEANPLANYWASWEPGRREDPSPITVQCQDLPHGPLAWWHDAVGIKGPDLARGSGIRVGIVDSGVAGHRCLAHVTRVGVFEGGNRKKDDDAYSAMRHGTHVCGLIGARSSTATDLIGIAPAAELFSARFRGDTVNQADLANAIDVLTTECQVDLINLSCGAPTASAILHDAILDAQDSGAVCVCAAGNSRGALEYPSAWPEAIAVAAIGQIGWGPANSVARMLSHVRPDRLGARYFSPKFTCFGGSNMIVAPGVGIVSTVPGAAGDGQFGEMTGTSMASPIACGTIAAVLSAAQGYRSAGPAERSKSVYAVIDGGSSAGLDPRLEGRGMIRL